jgi:hemolysin activation/secretion protein
MNLGGTALAQQRSFPPPPQFKIQSPLLAVPTVGDAAREEAKRKEQEQKQASEVQSPNSPTTPKTPEKQKVAAPTKKAEETKSKAASAPAKVAKPEVVEKKIETTTPGAAKPEAAGTTASSGTLVPAPGAQPMKLEPEANPDLKKLIDEANAAPTAVPIEIKRSTILILSLAGITLFPDDRKDLTDIPTTTPVTLSPGVNILEGLSTPEREALIKLLKDKYIGKPVSFEGLDTMVKDIIAFYSEKKRPMTHVYIPEQEISDKVKIAVLEGRLGEIKFPEDEKRRWYQPRRTKVPAALEAQKGEVLDMDKINSAVSALNISPWSRLGRVEAHPYRSASVALSPAPQIGFTDIELSPKTRTVFPIQTFAGWDNTGTVLLGENRFNFGTVWYDAFNTGYDHQLGLQYQSAEDFDLFHAVIASYQIPIRRWNQTLQFFAAYMQSTVDIPAAGVAQSLEGDTWLLGARYFFGLPTWFITEAAKKADDKSKQLALYHEIGFGFDFKSQDSNLLFGGVNVFPTKVDVAQFVGEYNIRQTDKWGETGLNIAFYYSPGELSGNNTDAEFLAARSGGTADYIYSRATLTRALDLGTFHRYLNDFKFLVRATGQWSNSNLLASEQLGLGGYDSVRGYPERTMRGDKGIFFQAELYSPAFHPLRSIAKKFPDRWTDADDKTDELRFLVFYDYGWGDNVNPTFAEQGDLNLSSVGVGLRYRFNKSMTLRFDYGIQLEALDPLKVNAFDLSPKYSSGGDNYAHLGLSISF